MKYTVELVNNRPRCKVMTQNQRLYIIEGYELYQFLKEIIDDEEKYISNKTNGNLFLTHKRDNETVTFKDYKNLEKPLFDLYTHFTKKETRERKIKEIKTKAAIGVIASSIITSVIAGSVLLSKGNNTEKTNAASEELLTPIDETNTIKVNNTVVGIPETEEVKIKTEPIMSTPPEEGIIEEIKKDVNQIQLDVNAVYDAGINKRNEPFEDIITERATKWGISKELMNDIVSQEYGGDDNNLTHVIYKSWKNQVLYAYNFETNSIESFVITDEPEKYRNINHVLTEADLYNPKSNVSAGAIILQFSLSQFNYNIPLGIQAYNNGTGAVNKILEETSKHTGLTKEEIIASDEPIWQKYTYIINEGKGKDDPKTDEEYFSNVVKHIDEDQQESKINDVYGVSYLNDNNEIETKEVQYKLR